MNRPGLSSKTSHAARLPLFPAFTAIALFLVWGCGGPSLSLLTDRPEFLAYREVFNAQQEDYWLEVIYHPSPADALADREPADVVVGSGLADPRLLGLLESTDRMFRRERIDSGAFYGDLLSLGERDEKRYALALSFSLPAVVFKPQAVDESIAPIVISLQDLRRIAKSFNRESEEGIQLMGFSPLWDAEFLYLVSRLFGVDFHIAPDRGWRWTQEALDRAVEYCRNWLEESSGGYESDQAFTAKYRNSPDYQLVEEERILFYVSDIRDFLQIPLEKRENLEIRWLSYENRIPVMDDVLFIGIPRHARNKRGAQAFLEWIFRPESQAAILETNTSKRLKGVFGIANGFSSLVEVNQREFPKPEHNPFFVGIIPTEEMLLFPPRLPHDWGQTKRAVLLPWLAESVMGSENIDALENRLSAGG